MNSESLATEGDIALSRVAAIESFLRRSVPGIPPIQTVRTLGGGTSNVTYLLETEVKRFVLRHGPLQHGLASAHDMHREYRVLSALQGSGVPVPRVVAYSDDVSVVGAPFYVMDYVPGVILADKPPVQPIPEGFATSNRDRVEIGLGLIRTLAALHAVVPASVGLDDFGRPAGYVERQVARWTEQWETWRTRDYPVMDEVLRRLKAATPRNSEGTIVHGDFRLGNLVLSRDDPGTVLAVLDWEMASLGDPIVDLGYTLIFWGEKGDSEIRTRSMDLASITAQQGFLSRAELVREYARVTHRDVSTVDFFEILGRVKLAIFAERGYARLLQARERGGEIDPLLLQHDDGWRGCNDAMEMALDIADHSEDPRLRGE